MKGLEPSRLTALAPKASVSTNSTTSAHITRYLIDNLVIISNFVHRIKMSIKYSLWYYKYSRLTGVIRLMNKITQYLNEHILGEVTSNKSVLEKFSKDGSVFSIKPELVVSPRTTNDIRKIARFTWQLAEKNRPMSMTVRGGGSDKTGAAIGKGIIINTLSHLNNIIFVSLKNKNQFIHVQPGVNIRGLNEILKSHGMIITGSFKSDAYSTIGGAIANNYENIGSLVSRMEVILANGDLIETSRIGKHELNKKKGLQTFEGEIYRKIDGIIEDNDKLLSSQNKEIANNSGYFGITKVKQRDGSFDLTPLIIGSQGTLGIISEIVIKTDFYNPDESILVATFENAQAARNVANSLMQLSPKILDIIDGRFFDKATEMGKKYVFSDDISDVNSVIYLSFNDFSEGARRHKIKKTLKIINKLNPDTKTFTSYEKPIEELYAVREVSSVILQPEVNEDSLPPLVDGIAVPAQRLEELITAINQLAVKHHIELPIYINWLTNTIDTRTALQLHNVSDKQKVFKLINDFAEVTAKLDGNMTANGGEGRIKTPAIYAQTDTELIEIYKQIRETFDPFSTLNPGVKQASDLKTLISYLNPDFNLSENAKYSIKL
jgi:FAD/FMN-containing dehydrogenase